MHPSCDLIGPCLVVPGEVLGGGSPVLLLLLFSVGLFGVVRICRSK